MHPSSSVVEASAQSEIEYESFEAALAAERQRMAEAKGGAKSAESPLTPNGFTQVFSALDASVKANPQANYEQWTQSSENETYVHVMKQLEGKDGASTLKPYQADVLRYMNLQTKLNTVQGMSDLEDKDKVKAVEELIVFAKEKLAGASDADKAPIATAIRSMGGTRGRLRGISSIKQPQESALAEYVRLAESDTTDKEALQTARKEMLFAVRCMNQDRDTYGFLAAKYPRGATESDELRAARDTQVSARAGLSELYARRQKRVFGADWMSSTHFNRQARSFNQARKDYRKSVDGQLALELNGREFTSAEQLNKHLAARAFRLASEFSDDVDANYRTNNSFVGKAINFFGGYDEKGEKNKSLPRKIGKFAVHAAVIGSAGVLTIATGGSLLAVSAGGAWAGANIYSRWEAKKRAERMQRSGASISEDYIKSQLDLLDTIHGPDSDESVRMAPIDLVKTKIGNVSRTIVNAAERDTISQQKRRLGRLAVSAAAGTAIAVGGHYLGAWIGGDHTAHAASATHHDVPQVAPSHTPVVPEIHAGPSTIFAHNNMGWYEVMQQMGIDPAQSHSVLVKAAPELVKDHLAYTMPDGLPGIPSTGYIPQAAIDIIAHAAGR